MFRARRRTRSAASLLAGWALLAGVWAMLTAPFATAAGHEICSAAASALDGGAPTGAPTDAPTDAPAGHAAGHCDFCSLHADTLAPPPAAIAGRVSPVARSSGARPWAEAPRSAPARTTAQARAPPLGAG